MQCHGLFKIHNSIPKVQGRNFYLFRKVGQIKSKNIEWTSSFSPLLITRRNHHIEKDGKTNGNEDLTKERTTKSKVSSKDADEDNTIVISGLSGRFPQTESIDEFKENLFNGLDMMSDQTRFAVGKKLPPRFGYLKNLDKFDADFFGVSQKLANSFDPAIRKLLEVVYETFVDAGINPETLKGTQTGIFVGTDGADPNSYWTLKHGREELNGYAALGIHSCLQANQVSHFLDLKGPSLVVSTGCSSSLYTMEAAMNSIESGKCDRAIVAATSLHFCSHHSYDFMILGALSPTGDSRPFDKRANGFVRSEAVVSMLIEKKSVAKRNYATIRGIQTSSDGMKKEGIFFPLSSSQENLYKRLYNTAGVDPGSVTYIETHGTGTHAGDPQEVQGISNVFAKADSRTEPLLIGSVKSNMGHGEAAAGLCGIAKVLIAAQEGFIPPNLHFDEPNENLVHLFDGSIKVVTDKTPLTGKLIGLNCFGFGGTNSHIILEPKVTPNSDFPHQSSVPRINSTKSNSKAEINDQRNLPILVPISGREEQSTKQSLEKACAHAKNPNYTGLLHQVFKKRISNHDYRGYGIIQQNSAANNNTPLPIPTTQLKRITMEEQENRPIWFVFPGMGSQWQGMGEEMMKISVFQDSVRKSRITLKNAGVDLDKLLSKSNAGIFEDIRQAFNSIAVMQIALYDTLKSIGIHPNGFFGHSFGEILCAYADGCLSSEETLLVADARGRAMIEGAKNQNQNQESGSMAAIGLSWMEVNRRLSSDSGSKSRFGYSAEIVAACHNGPQSVTISGRQTAIKDFVKELQEEGIFAKEVNSCQIAAHSPLIYPASKLYLKYMEDIYAGRNKDGRKRSQRWVSTSIPESESGTILALNSSPEYFVNNFINPVLFHEAVQHVPKEAVVIEIAPQGLFQGILKSSLPGSCALFAPMQRKAEDKLLHFFASIGDIYNAGVDVNMANLYPEINFPVNAKTPSLSPLIKWKHDSNWIVPIVENTEKYTDGVINIDLNESAYKFLEGHKLDDRLVFPATGYLLLAWKSLAACFGRDFNKLPVTFENVSIERAIFLSNDIPTQLRCSIHKGSGIFEIHENGTTVANGKIFTPEKIPERFFSQDLLNIKDSDNSEDIFLSSEDIYKEMRIRGYKFQGDFQSISKIDLDGRWAEVNWNGNWTTLLDSVIQVSFFKDNLCRSTAVPVRFTSLKINPIELQNYVDVEGSVSKDILPVSNNIHMNKTIAPGIELNAVTAHVIQRKDQKGNLIIGEYLFTPYFPTTTCTKSQSSDHDQVQKILPLFLDIFLENFSQKQVQVQEIFTKSENYSRPMISKILATQPLHDMNVTSMSTESELLKLKNKNKDIEENNSNFKSKSDFADITSKATVEELLHEVGQADLIFLDDINLVRNAAGNLKNDSWIILRNCQNETANDKLMEENQNKSLEDTGLEAIAQDLISGTRISLLKKKLLKAPTLDQIQSISIDTKFEDWLPKLKSLLSTNNTSNQNTSRIYIYSQNNPSSGIIGLVKCLRREPNGQKIRCIFDPEGHLEINFNNPSSILNQIIRKDLLMNIYQKGQMGSYRHIPLNTDFLTLPSKEVHHARVNTLTVGDLSSLRWIESPLKFYPKDQLCSVNYASLNFRDIMLSTAKLPMSSKSSFNSIDSQIGLEFAGTDYEGKRVMGVAINTLATFVLTSANSMLWSIPKSWSMEEAATVPVVYATAYYALLDRGRMERGQSILIHSGTGGVGQAAINIALNMDCQVFTTVGTGDKRQYIKQLFPTLKDRNIGNSRDCTFEKQVLEMTSGRGVDLVLNSLAEDKLQASLNCIALGGKFLEIGKFDILRNSSLGMEHLARNVDIMGVDLVPLFTNGMAGKEKIINLVEEGVANGVVKPLDRTVFDHDKTEDAFRYMAAGKHVGKVLIEVKKEYEENELTKEGTKKIKAIGKSYFNPQETYIIIGGLGGFGLELANWMVERGAQHLVLLSRSGVTTGYQQLCLKKWRKLGVTIETPKGKDLKCFNTADTFIQSYTKEGRRLGGIFNSGLVLKDALIENQTKEMFEEVCGPKIDVTRNLDLLTRKYCPNLEYFVTFSSLSAGLGNAGQSNYGLANSAMEQICQRRKEDGFQATAIQWGVIGDVGYVADNMVEDKVFDGMNPQRIVSCLQVLDALLEKSKNSVLGTKTTTCFSSMVVSDKTGDRKSKKKIALTEIVAKLCSIKSLKDIDPKTKLADLGLDSLSGTELQQLLDREYECQLTSTKIRALTWGELKLIEQGLSINAKEGKSDFEMKEDNERFKELKEASTCERKKILIKLNGGSGSGSEIKVDRNTRRLFMVHGGDGQALPFAPLATKLSCEVYAFQTGLKDFGKLAQVPVMEYVAEEYIKELKLVQPEGPYDIAGYSVGGCIAFAMVNLLESKYKDKVNNLVILDGYCFFGLPPTEEKSIKNSVKSLLEILERIISLNESEKRLFLNNLHPTSLNENRKLLLEIIENKIAREQGENKIGPSVQTYYETMVTLGVMAHEFKPSENLRANVSLIKARSSVIAGLDSYSLDYKFQQFCKNSISVSTVGGDHQSIFFPENVQEIAGILTQILKSSKNADAGENESEEEHVLEY